VHFVGRLATYKYYNMDQITAQALTTYGKISGQKRDELPARRPSAATAEFTLKVNQTFDRV
jgi:UDP-galactopyranose mutase